MSKSNKAVMKNGFAHYENRDLIQDDAIKDYLLYPPDHQDANIKEIDKINKLLLRNDDIDYMDYDKEHVLYMYATAIDNIKDNRLIVKVGYSNDLIKRNTAMKLYEYKCEMLIVGIKRVYGSNDEQKWHKNFKEMYPNLHYKTIFTEGIKKKVEKEKVELYYYNDKIVSFFDKFKPDKEANDEIIKLKYQLADQKESYEQTIDDLKWLLKLKDYAIEIMKDLQTIKYEKEFYCNR